MNNEAQERLNELLKKDPNSLTGAEIEFLNARRSYLTDEQKAVLDKLPQQQEEANETRNEDEATEVNTSASAAEVTGADVEGADTSECTPDYSKMTKAELQDELTARKIQFNSSANKDELVGLLENADK